MTLRQPKYTDKFRASAVVMLMAAGWPDVKGAQSKVAKHLGVPRQTLIRWAEAEQNPPPPQLVQEKAAAALERFEHIVLMAQQRTIDALSDPDQADEVSAKDAMWIASVGIDKLRLLRGESTENNAVNVRIQYDND